MVETFVSVKLWLDYRRDILRNDHDLDNVLVVLLAVFARKPSELSCNVLEFKDLLNDCIPPVSLQRRQI